MSMTLKLSQVSWDAHPYTWEYESPVEGSRATSIGRWTDGEWTDMSIEAKAGYTGGARWWEETPADIEKRTGYRFEWDKLHDDGVVYVMVNRSGAVDDARDERGNTIFPGSDACEVWQLSDTEGLPADFDPRRLVFHTNPAHDQTTWISDVRQVNVIGEVQPTWRAIRDVINCNDPRFRVYQAPGEGIEIHTWMGPEKKTIRKVIMVIFTDNSVRMMLVERAWLLGPNGDTIDKICP